MPIVLENLLELPRDPDFVRSLQKRLAAHQIEIEVDGYWGPKTQAALERFADARGCRGTFALWHVCQELYKGPGSKFPATAMAGHRHISEDGLIVIKAFEGLCLKSYKCSGQVWTIGYGTTKGVVPGMEITEQVADELLARDVQKSEKAVLRLVKVKVDDNQFASLVSFTYNLGEGQLADSTMLRLLNDGAEKKIVANEFERFVFAGGKKQAGLERRRKCERALFLGEDYKSFLYE